MTIRSLSQLGRSTNLNLWGKEAWKNVGEDCSTRLFTRGSTPTFFEIATLYYRDLRFDLCYLKNCLLHLECGSG